MTNATSAFLGLTDDADPRDRPPTTTADDDTLLRDLKGVLKGEWATHARSQQKAIGPSEIGHPCPRKLATKMLGMPAIAPDGDPLPAWLGTAGHSKFETAIEHANDQIIDAWLRDRSQRCTTADRGDGVPIGRWLTERRVTVRGELAGTCDLYDTWTDTVIDLKFPGASRLRVYQKQGPSPEYRVQAHTYGRGYRNEGFSVKRVAIWFLPRGGNLRSSFVWSEAYDDAIVDDVLAKLDKIALVLDDLDIEEHPERLASIPRHPYNCEFCPYFTPQAGHPEPQACTGGAK